MISKRKEEKMNKDTFIYAFRTSLPIMAGYIFLGIAYGVLLESYGYGWIWAFLSSLIIYAGSMQFVQVELLASFRSIPTAIIMTILVNLRMMFYGIPMLEKYRGFGLIKPYLIFSLSDETFAVVSTIDIPKEINKKSFYIFFSLLNQIYWILGSIIGAVLGMNLNFNIEGIGFSMTCLFVVIFIDQWKNTNNRKPQILGLLISLFTLILIGPERFLIPAVFLIIISMFPIRDDLLDKGDMDDEK